MTKEEVLQKFEERREEVERKINSLHNGDDVSEVQDELDKLYVDLDGANNEYMYEEGEYELEESPFISIQQKLDEDQSTIDDIRRMR